MKDPSHQLSFDFISDSEMTFKEVSGRVKNIIYDNPYTGWKVVELTSSPDDTVLKLAGYLPNIHPEDHINALCTRMDHPIFGECLQIDEFNKELPFQKDGVMKFLVSMVDGIGERLAENIVDKFKDLTLIVLEEEPERLTEVDGINDKLVERVRKCTENINTTVKELVLMGFSQKWAGRIYLKYGKDAAEKIKIRPYNLINDFKGIGFKKAEIIAHRIGVDELDEERLKAAIIFSMRSALKMTGHNFIYLDELKEAISKLLHLPRAFIESEILSQKDLVIEEARVYLPEYYHAEQSVAKKIAKKLFLPKREIKDFDAVIKKIEEEVKISFSEAQKESISGALKNSITVITGAAGTGKTTICVGLLKYLEELGSSYAVCAPTGKAANRLKSMTGAEASTIHRLLRYAPSIGFRVNEKEPLKVDYVIVDEASMVDLLLLKALFEGISDRTRLVFIGDPHQIPPVEAGNSLQALIGSYSVSQVVLPEIFRQKKESTILKNANLVNIEKIFPLENTDDFKFINVEAPMQMIKALYDSIEELKKEGFHPIRDINVLTPLNTGGGDISVSNLNFRLRDYLNPVKGENSFPVFETEFRLGDKVMQRKNDYELDIYNGEIGIITNNDRMNRTVEVDFFGRSISVPYAKMENIALNYAMTVHKSQGSESRAVIFLATRAGCYFLLSKNLFYTAITRAKEKLIMIMPYEVVKMAIRYNIPRQSTLSQRIQQFTVGREPVK
ncbi:MAG: AAA family ATPase [Spirochaetes bacterium]|nr:AAA family ATPase [Spirochaetota bacterium]